MSFDDQHFKAKHYVRHQYGPRRAGRPRVCRRCGVQRRYRMSAWEYRHPGQNWLTINPPCAVREVKP